MNTKKEAFVISAVLMIFLIFLGTASAACTLDVELINQDPSPVSPGENVKVLFQVEGVSNPECGEVSLNLIENFPFTIDPSTPAIKTIQSGIFVRDYSPFWLVPYTIRVDDNAKKGVNKLEVEIRDSGSTSGVLKEFDIEVENVQTEFEIHVKDYSKSEQTITLEILNIGEQDIDALSIEIPEQENIQLLGNGKNIIGVLDSNEYTTTTFQATAKKGELRFIVKYNDLTGTRRTIEESTLFDPTPFDLKEQGNKKGSGAILTIVIILALAVSCWFYRREKRRQKNLRKKD